MAIRTSLITVQLGMAASDIAGARQKMTEARAAVTYVNGILTGIPTKYAEMIAAVNAAGYDADANGAAQKALLANLTTEFAALQVAVSAAQTALTSGVTEY
jgi:hypothetical protein